MKMKIVLEVTSVVRQKSLGLRKALCPTRKGYFLCGNSGVVSGHAQTRKNERSQDTEVMVGNFQHDTVSEAGGFNGARQV